MLPDGVRLVFSLLRRSASVVVQKHQGKKVKRENAPETADETGAHVGEDVAVQLREWAKSQLASR